MVAKPVIPANIRTSMYSLKILRSLPACGSRLKHSKRKAHPLRANRDGCRSLPGCCKFAFGGRGKGLATKGTKITKKRIMSGLEKA